MSDRNISNGTLLGLPPAELAAKFFAKRPTARRIDSLVGTTLAGRYLVEELVGEGGMATVFRGRHLAIQKQVAIKVLDPALHVPDAVERFLQEAQATSLIRHEHVVEVTDFGATEDDVVFSVMELLSGETLHTTLEHEGKLAPERAAGIIRQICQGLHAAHEQGVIHRDLKPENCFRTPRTSSPDFMKVLDFGIAKVNASAATAMTAAPRKTQVGMVVGTPAYMAPEQARAELCDARSDVYSAGILLYRMLAGVLPFDKPTSAELLAQQMYAQARPLLEIDSSLPPSICAVADKAMQKKPEDRFASMAEMVLAIDGALEAYEAFTTGEGVYYQPTLRDVATQTAATRRTRLPWVLGLGAGALVVAATVGWSLSRVPDANVAVRLLPIAELSSSVQAQASPTKAGQGSEEAVESPVQPPQPALEPVEALAVDESPAPSEDVGGAAEPTREEPVEPSVAEPSQAPKAGKPGKPGKPGTKPRSLSPKPSPQARDIPAKPSRDQPDEPSGKISEVKNPFDD